MEKIIGLIDAPFTPMKPNGDINLEPIPAYAAMLAKNGLKAIKVTFDSGILFDFNKSTLKADAKRNLDKFAAEMADLPDTDITVLGHTDNIGSAAANQKVSDNRANAVSNYLQNKGIAKSRIVAEGHSFNDPVADNSTAEGRAQNRRVEIFISANEDMIKAAEEGKLQ